MKFPIPRDCEEESEVNCCSYDIEGRSHNYTCFSGTTLIWKYSTAEWAREAMESVLPQRLEQAKNPVTENMSCYLLGQKLPAVKIVSILPDNEIFCQIHVNGTINGQSFYLQFYSDKDVKNNEDIPPGIRQIFKVTN